MLKFVEISFSVFFIHFFQISKQALTVITGTNSVTLSFASHPGYVYNFYFEDKWFSRDEIFYTQSQSHHFSIFLHHDLQNEMKETRCEQKTGWLVKTHVCSFLKSTRDANKTISKNIYTMKHIYVFMTTRLVSPVTVLLKKASFMSIWYMCSLIINGKNLMLYCILKISSAITMI